MISLIATPCDLRLAYSEPAWKADLQRAVRRSARRALLAKGNVVFLPRPIAAYRLRHSDDGVHIEIVSRGGHVTAIGRAPNALVARAALDDLGASHSRPVLPELFDRTSA